jgi:Alpha/beta hydrolase family
VKVGSAEKGVARRALQPFRRLAAVDAPHVLGGCRLGRGGRHRCSPTTPAATAGHAGSRERVGVRPVRFMSAQSCSFWSTATGTGLVLGRLIPELEAAGHEAPLDLPIKDVAAGCTSDAAVALEALGDPRNGVVVGHSTGGLTIPLVAAARPVRRLIFVCALLPSPGLSLEEQSGPEPEISTDPRGLVFVRDADGFSFWPDADRAAEGMYHDCDPAHARWAFARLRRQAPTPAQEACPLHRLPDVPTSYLLCSADRMVNPDWSRRAARARLGVEPRVLPGGHTPMLSRPRALAAALIAEAER